jgi:site-specific recombinase XerD
LKTHELVTAFLEAKQDLSPRTLEQYRQTLGYLVQECPEVPDKPQPLRSALMKVSKPYVRDACWRVWRVFFHWSSLDYEIPDPMQRVQRPKLPVIEMRVLEPLDLAHVMAAADNLRDKAILALALDSGIRASEFGRLCALDIGKSTLWVWGKGRKRVQVPISPETRQLLQVVMDNREKRLPEEPLFTDQEGKPVSRFSVYHVVRKCMDKAGVTGPKRGPHCLRHSLGTNFAAAGGDVFALQRIMRHTNISTTQKYVHLAMHTVVEHHNRYSPVRDALRGAQGILIEREVETILDTKLKERK